VINIYSPTEYPYLSYIYLHYIGRYPRYRWDFTLLLRSTLFYHYLFFYPMPRAGSY